MGQKGLSVNPSKTVIGGIVGIQVEKEIDEVKAYLLRKRREAMRHGYDVEDEDIEEADLFGVELSERELEYIRDLLKSEHLGEEDAELVLSIFRNHIDEVKPHLQLFSTSFPHLAKSIWSFCRHIDDKEFIADLLLSASRHASLQEYQLFWFAWILQDYLMQTKQAPAIIGALYGHQNATAISRAKILEIPDNRFGLVEMRDENLVAGCSDWLAWASAVGHRNLPPISRNHKLEYFGNSSQMNHLIMSIVTIV